MATFKITEILTFATTGPHTMTDWIVLDDDNRDNPVVSNLNDTENLLTYRTPLFKNRIDGEHITDCTNITCIVRVMIDNAWSPEFTLRPIPHHEDIIT